MSAIAATGSTEVDEVVPIVATIAIGSRPAVAVRGDRGRQRLGLAARSARSTGIRTSDAAPEPERHARLLDRAVRLGGRVDAQRAGSSARPARPRARHRRRPPRGPPPARSATTSTPCRSAGHRTPPAARAPGAASRRRRSSSSVPIGEVRHSIAFWPRAAVSISPRIPGPDAVVAKYARKPGMLPVRGVRLDEAPVVGEDRVDRLRALGRRRREERAERARLDRREDGARLDRLEVVGHHVDDGVRGRAELGGRPCRRSAAAGRRVAGRSRARVYRGERLLDGVADPREDVADLRAEQDQRHDAQDGEEQEQADDDGAGQRQPARSRPGRPDQGGVRELVVQALLRGADRRRTEEDDPPDELDQAQPRGTRQDQVEQRQEQAEADPAPKRLLDRERMPVERVATWIPKMRWPIVARRPPDQKNTK